MLDWTVAWGGSSFPAPLRRLCNAAREDGLAAWVATLQGAAIATVAWCCWAVVRYQPGARARRHGWLVVALVLSWVAIDDGARIHEGLGTMFDQALDPVRRDPEAAGVAAWLGRYPSYGWQLAVGPPLAFAGAFLFAFLAHELRGARARRLLAATALAFGLAIGMDFVEGLDRDHPWNLYSRLAADERFDDWSHRHFDASAFATVLHGGRALEELLEIAAGTALLTLLVGRLGSGSPRLRLHAGDGAA